MGRKKKKELLGDSPTFFFPCKNIYISGSAPHIFFFSVLDIARGHSLAPTMMFRDQVGVLAGWFKGWNECEQTVALLSLLKRVTRSQARFLQLCLEHSLADCTELHVLENEANSPGEFPPPPTSLSPLSPLLPSLLVHPVHFECHIVL